MSIIAKNVDMKIKKANLFKQLKNYSSIDIALLEEEIITATEGFTKALDRCSDREQHWFGALDIFCEKKYGKFLDEFKYVKKFIKDWTELKDGNEHSARCQFGRIFYQILDKRDGIHFEYRKNPGINFEYRRVYNIQNNN